MNYKIKSDYQVFLYTPKTSEEWIDAEHYAILEYFKTFKEALEYVKSLPKLKEISNNEKILNKYKSIGSKYTIDLKQYIQDLSGNDIIKSCTPIFLAAATTSSFVILSLCRVMLL